MVKIILIHSGNIFPTHLNDCIFNLKNYGFEIHLIINEKLIEFIEFKYDIIISKIEDYEDSIFSNFQLIGYDNNFRDGFWRSTTNRFFILKNYAKVNKLESFFHIENDILLYTNLIQVEKILNDTNKKMALVIDSFNRCVPSITWYNNFSILEELCDFILNNNHNDDMRNLYCFFEKQKMDIINLPIIPELRLHGINFDNMFEDFNSIFDGAAIGQYFGGIDPRNEEGNTIGFVNETTIFDVSSFEYSWIEGEPYMNWRNNKVKINNLHIHSKNLKKFLKWK